MLLSAAPFRCCGHLHPCLGGETVVQTEEASCGHVVSCRAVPGSLQSAMQYLVDFQVSIPVSYPQPPTVWALVVSSKASNADLDCPATSLSAQHDDEQHDVTATGEHDVPSLPRCVVQSLTRVGRSDERHALPQSASLSFSPSRYFSDV